MLIVDNSYIYNKTNNSYTNKNMKVNPSFGYRLPKNPVTDIRDISHLHCACCGHDTLRTSDILGILKTFTAGSKRALENSLLQPYKDTDAFKFLKELSTAFPKMSISNIVKTPEGLSKIKTFQNDTQFEISKIALLSESITVKAPVVMKRLQHYYELFNDYNREILCTLNNYSLKYPNKTFAEIFKMPEVIKYHSKQFDKNQKSEMKQRIAIFKGLRNLYPKMTAQEIREIQSVNSKALVVINNEYYKPHIKKLLVEELYKDYSSKLQDNLKPEIMNYVSRIPCGESNIVHRFITEAYRANKTDMDIVEYFIRELQATFEHIIAKSKNGPDHISNGIMLCKQCNVERSDISYLQYLKIHPEMRANLQKQINKVITFIKHGKLIGYDNYPVEVKPVLLKASDNFLKIRINNILKFKEKQSRLAYQNAESVYIDQLKNYYDITSKLDEVNSKLDELQKVFKTLKKEKRIISEKLSLAEEQKEYLKTSLDNKKAALNASIDAIKADEELNKSLKSIEIMK